MRVYVLPQSHLPAGTQVSPALIQWVFGPAAANGFRARPRALER